MQLAYEEADRKQNQLCTIKAKYVDISLLQNSRYCQPSNKNNWDDVQEESAEGSWEGSSL